MRADPQALHQRSFDFLVIGGGIHGAAIAREAALAGCSVLLVERDDFASGTSMRSSRLVHGGVRYLQNGHIALVREALRERERLLRLAPHLVRPLPMLMPFFAGAGKPAWMLRLGLRLYQWLASGSTLPGPSMHDARACARLFPALVQTGLRGGALYHDAATEDLRLTLAVLEAAAAAGAQLANHVEVVGPRGGAVGLRSVIDGAELEVQAAHVVNATGPHADQLRRRLGIEGPDLIRTTRGRHLVLAPRTAETALAAFLADGRIQFVIPHRDGTICGTTDVEERIEDAGPTVPAADVEYLLSALAHLLEEPPARTDIRFAYAGWRSLPAAVGPPGRLNREAFRVTEPTAVGQLHTIVGGKLTTHRAFAERIVDEIVRRRRASPSRTTPLPGGDGPREVTDPLWWRHGSRAPRLRALAREDSSWLAPICPHRPLLRVEAVFALRAQGAVTFTDLMLRRLFHTQGPCLQEACLRSLHVLYLEQRQWRAPDSFDAARDELVRAVEHMRGDMPMTMEQQGLATGGGASRSSTGFSGPADERR